MSREAPSEGAEGRPGVEVHRIAHLGATLYVESEGEGSPILLLHGGLGHQGTVAGLRAALVGWGFRVVAIDSRGMGRSSLGDAGLSYQQQELDAVHVLDQLRIDACGIVGVSDGGITGLRLAARGEGRVRALATVGSRWRAEDSQHLWEVFPRVDRATLGVGPYAPVVADYDRLSPDQDFDRLGELYNTLWRDASPAGHPGDSVDRIEIPVLIAVGDRDPIVPLGPCVELHQRLDNSQLLVLPNAGHEAHTDRADLYHPALEEFLNGLP